MDEQFAAPAVSDLSADTGSGGPQTSYPPRSARFALTGILLLAYFLTQIVIATPVFGWWVIKDNLQSPDQIDALIVSEQGIWLSLIAAGIAAVLTIVLALNWPRLWKSAPPRPTVPFSEWLAWLPPQQLPFWSIPLLTLGLIAVASVLIDRLSGSPEVAAQLALFSTASLQIGSTIIISSVVPVAEEFIFRGAMYNALLRRPASSGWLRHLLPVVVTSLTFAAVHALAGFESAASFLLIAVFALFLGTLRAVTGSVQTTIVAHAVWNILGSLALVAANNLPS